MALFNGKINKILEIFFPWVTLKWKNKKIKVLNYKIIRKKNAFRTKQKIIDKIFSKLNINFESLHENYLKNSMNNVSLNSEKIIVDIKEKLIIPENLINLENNNHKTIVSYETIKHESQFFGNEKNKNLIIFISGNESTHPGQKESVKNVMNKIDNCDTLWLSIFNRGLNLKYRSELSFKGLENCINSPSIENYTLKNNDILKFYQGDNNKINPMSLFLSGNYYLIKDAISKKKYDKITLLGLSTGGLSATFYGTLFEEINSTWTFDGIVPSINYFFSPLIRKYFYFYDNTFIEEYDYDILYFIILLNKKTKKDLNLFFSEKYWGKQEVILKKLMNKFDLKNFFMDHNLKSHDFDADIILNLIKKNN